MKWREEHGRRFRNGGYEMTALRPFELFNFHPEQKGFTTFPFIISEVIRRMMWDSVLDQVVWGEKHACISDSDD